MKKNLWILTEESVHLIEIKKIVRHSSLEHNLNIEFSKASIKPVVKNNIFQHQYYLDGFISPKVNNIFINSVGPSKINPFVDFIVFLKEKKPKPKDLFKDCIFIIEATKTNTYDSRNTAMGQRSSKFVHLSYYYENSLCKAQPVMYYTHEQAEDDHDW